MQLQRGDFAIDAQFSAPTPGITALYGRSGAGKTTLMHLLAGLLRRTTGRSHWTGNCCSIPQREWMCRRIDGTSVVCSRICVCSLI